MAGQPGQYFWEACLEPWCDHNVETEGGKWDVDVMQMENSRGPSADPCGTSEVRLRGTAQETFQICQFEDLNCMIHILHFKI